MAEKCPPVRGREEACRLRKINETGRDSRFIFALFFDIGNEGVWRYIRVYRRNGRSFGLLVTQMPSFPALKPGEVLAIV